MKKSLIIILIASAALLSAGFLFIYPTTKDTLNKEEYISWIESEKNGMRKLVESGGLTYEVTYCPLSYMIAKEFHVQEIDSKSYEERVKELAGMHYFKLRIRRTNSNADVMEYKLEGGQDGYYKRSDYLSYGLEEDLRLLQNGFLDTLKPAIYHFERTYSLAPYADFMIAFEKDSALRDKHVVFMLNDKVFGEGVQRFDFNTDKEKDLPKLLVK